MVYTYIPSCYLSLSVLLSIYKFFNKLTIDFFNKNFIGYHTEYHSFKKFFNIKK